MLSTFFYEQVIMLDGRSIRIERPYPQAIRRLASRRGRSRRRSSLTRALEANNSPWQTSKNDLFVNRIFQPLVTTLLVRSCIDFVFNNSLAKEFYHFKSSIGRRFLRIIPSGVENDDDATSNSSDNVTLDHDYYDLASFSPLPPPLFRWNILI